MRSVMGCVLVLLAGVAHGSDRHENWGAVERLATGDPILVDARGQGRAEICEVVAVDDSLLTCDRLRDPEADWTRASGARLLIPRSAVTAVWRWQRDDRPNPLTWIGIGALVAIETAAAVAGGVAGLLVIDAVLIPAVGAAASDPMHGPPVPHPPKMRRRLIYRAAAARRAPPAVAP